MKRLSGKTSDSWEPGWEVSGLGANATAADFGISFVNAAKDIGTSIVRANTPPTPRPATRVTMPAPRPVQPQSRLPGWAIPVGVGVSAFVVGYLLLKKD